MNGDRNVSFLQAIGTRLNFMGGGALTIPDPNSTLVPFRYEPEIIEQPSGYFTHLQNRVEDIEQALVFLGGYGIRVNEGQKIISFLQQHHGIVQHLWELPAVLASFLQDSEFTLQVIEEKNAADEINTKDLLLSIETRKNINEAKLALKRMEQEWLFSLPEADMNLFFFSLKFKDAI